jgi:hypothetical protein
MSKHERQPIKPIHPNHYDGRHKVEVLMDRHVDKDNNLTGGTAVLDNGLAIEWRLVCRGPGGRQNTHVRYFNHGRNLPTKTVETNNPGITHDVYRAIESMRFPEHCSYWFDDELMVDENGQCALEGEALEKAAHEKRLQEAQEAESQYDAWHKEGHKEVAKPHEIVEEQPKPVYVPITEDNLPF